MGIENSNFIRACHGSNDGPVPIWIMRQAGRYLPEFRAIRKKVPFWDLCRSPELVAEVVRQPIERFGLDAAILFSDILIILEPMGIGVEFKGGPHLDKVIDTPEAVKQLVDFDIDQKLPFVMEGIKKVRQVLPKTPLIGFAGSPFTIACYLIEGRGSKNFEKTKQFIHRYPAAAAELRELITNITSRYLQAQVEAGVHVVQLFESWGGILSREDFRQWSVEPIARIFATLKDKNVPRIVFVNNIAPYIDMVSEIDCEAVGVDYRMDLKRAAKELPGKSIQGNLDPAVLFGSPEHVRQKTTTILESIDEPQRLIFNLGHGIQQHTPIESVEAMVEIVHNYRWAR